MSKDIDTCFLEDSEGLGEKKSLIQRYLQNPFSLAWSKLADLFQTAPATSRSEVVKNTHSVQSAQSELNPSQERDLSPPFRVQTECLVLDANLQEFAQKVSYICAFHTGGKLSTEEAYANLEQLWNKYGVQRGISE
jgi:hypothetical protein